jgi:hypothetical protein
MVCGWKMLNNDNLDNPFYVNNQEGYITRNLSINEVVIKQYLFTFVDKPYDCKFA